MPRPRVWMLTLPLLAALYASAPAGAPRSAEKPAQQGFFDDFRLEILNPQALAARIDHHILEGWQASKVQPAPAADDAEFLRRAYLDLAGRIPSVTEARQFLDDKGADKRERLIDHLLSSQRYAAHFSKVLRALWLPEAASTIQGQLIAPGFETWLRKHLADNTSYDRIVHELLTVKLTGDGPRGIEESIFGRPSPVGFFLAKEVKPENLAAGTARLFLGVKIECAQCHPHPFAEWKREQFWQLAAFFSGIQGQTMNEFTLPTADDVKKTDIKIPETDKVVQATFLDRKKPTFKDGVSPRVTLAEWVTAADNPFFARAAVNRVWSYFFGIGLHDPVDEMVGTDARPSHPALLDELARQFIANKYDLKYLMRAITLSRTYQLTSSGKPAANETPDRFARVPVRGLTGEQLFDSISQATGYVEAAGFPISFLPGKPSPRVEFLTRFNSLSEKSTDYQASILQALALMNGRLVTDATTLEKSETLAAVADAPFMTTSDRIETLYLATLSRRPRAEELSRFVRYVDGGGSAGRPSRAAYQRALADVFWVLLNSGEFMLNH